jgi:light-regulated signal transduction histidine kinase (bacteriophytochrome)
MKQVLKNLEASIKESNAEIIAENLPTVLANSTQLQQVLQNLVANSIKFRGARVPRVSIRAKQVGAEWLFELSDNGIGIAAEHADRIFVIFQRLHTREEYSGNGIGLSICKKIIERHGGRIWVSANEQEGATFHFTLPQTEKWKTEQPHTKELNKDFNEESNYEETSRSLVSG